MKKLLKVLSLLLVLVMLISMSSCDIKTEDNPGKIDATEKVKETETVDPTPLNEKITVTDQIGRTVSLAKPAERVVSCYYITSYAVIALGAAKCLVGIEKKANTRPIYKMTDSSLLDLPVVGSLKEISVETIAAQTPDLVILPKKLSSYIEAIEALGITTVVVNPETDNDLREMMKILGALLGASDKANQLLEFYDDKINSFSAPTEKPSVLFLSNSSYLAAAPSGMYQNDLITLAGGVNALAENKETYWQTISYETILQLDPDYIVIPCAAEYTADTISSDEVLKDLKAVKNGNIISFPSSFEEWDSPIPSAVLGVLWLRASLNPGVYSQETFKQDLIQFYQTFYGFTPSSDAVETLF